VLYSGSVIGVFGVVAAVWVKCFMKQRLFSAGPVTVAGEARVA
jgi:hypothetical protein